MDYFSRHSHYKILTSEIIKEGETDKEKVMAIFKWTHENIRKAPDELPIVDDHILNIILRGYGTSDQSADVFCMLCEYAGIPAAWALITPEPSNQKSPAIAVSLVKLGEKWRLFDSYFGNYFLNKNGEVATINELIANQDLINKAKHKPIIRGIEYVRFFDGLKKISEKDLWKRAKAQMPLPRLFSETKKLIK